MRSHATTPHGARVAFTLIEVMVVVAIIALLLAVLLPSLARGREQARSIVCLSNLRQILTVTGLYLQDSRGVVPIGPHDRVWDSVGLDGKVYKMIGGNCYWGGQTGVYHYSKDRAELARPITRYMYRHMPKEDKVAVFRCPSDRGSPFWPVSRQYGTIYTTCGNSYYMNTHGEFPRLREHTRVPDDRRIIYMEANVLWLLGMYPPTLRTLYGWGEETAPQQGTGWHGEVSRFNVAFMDLHAGNTRMDTRRLYGPGWTVTPFPRIWGWIPE